MTTLAPPPLALTVTGLAAGGEGVARDSNGRVVLVEGALPGERVEAELWQERASYARARVVAVIESSPDRARPPCPHVARGCGGCAWQHVSPPAQLELKRGLVVDALERLGGVRAPAVLSGPSLEAVGYRTTLRVAVAGPDVAGFRRRRSHEVVGVDSCLVAHPWLEEILVNGSFGTATEAVLRCGARTGQRLGVLSPSAQGADLGEAARAVGEDELAAGRRAWIYEEVLGARLRISAKSFFQARPDGAEVLVDLVAAALAGVGPGPFVDAYGGVGLFGATVAAGRAVTVVERSASSAADARVNVSGARVCRVDVERWRPTRAAIVVADPPRSGLGARAASVLAETGAGHLVLVSCDAPALGRDAGLLAGLGYQLESTTVLDMFPGAPHLEAVSTFVRRRGASGGGAGRRHARP